MYVILRLRERQGMKGERERERKKEKEREREKLNSNKKLSIELRNRKIPIAHLVITHAVVQTHDTVADFADCLKCRGSHQNAITPGWAAANQKYKDGIRNEVLSFQPSCNATSE